MKIKAPKPPFKVDFDNNQLQIYQTKTYQWLFCLMKVLVTVILLELSLLSLGKLPEPTRDISISTIAHQRSRFAHPLRT